MKKILITGGAGYIGSYICRLLTHHGYKLLIIDNFKSGNRNFLELYPSQVGDITNLKFIERTFNEFRPDCVIHLAAYCNPLESLNQPESYYRNNSLATLDLLKVMKRHEVKEIIYASSSAVYQDRLEHIPYVEGHPYGSSSPYARSKLIGEELIKEYSKTCGLRYVTMRHFNPSGADNDTKTGYSLPIGKNHAVAALVKVALNINSAFEFYGTDYQTPDGSSIRDYIHVCDIATAHLHALDYLNHGGESLTVNIGTGIGTSLKQLLYAVEAMCGYSLPVEYHPKRDIYQAYLTADISQAQKCLGWEPTYTLENIIDTTFQWYKNHQKLL